MDLPQERTANPWKVWWAELRISPPFNEKLIKEAVPKPINGPRRGALPYQEMKCRITFDYAPMHPTNRNLNILAKTFL